MKLTKSSIKVLALCIAMILLAMTAVLLIVRVSDGGRNMDVKSWTFQRVNDKNLYQKTTFEKSFDGGRANGVIVTVDDNKEISVSSNKAMDTTKVKIGEITLSAGKTYQFNSGVDAASQINTMYMTVELGENAYASYGATATISGQDIAEDTVASIYVIVAKDFVGSGTFKPVIVEGATTAAIVDFYA